MNNDFFHLQPGDMVIRDLAGLKMRMVVQEVLEEQGLILCEGGWTFDRKTGVEEDPDIGWGVKFGVTGSRLCHDPVID